MALGLNEATSFSEKGEKGKGREIAKFGKYYLPEYLSSYLLTINVPLQQTCVLLGMLISTKKRKFFGKCAEKKRKREDRAKNSRLLITFLSSGFSSFALRNKRGDYSDIRETNVC